MSEESAEVAVTQSSDRGRYEITVDHRQAGFIEYVDHNGQRILYHTEVAEGFGGRGLGSTLIGRALVDTRAAGLRIVAVCPFVENYLASHHDVDDVVEEVTPDALAAVRERTG